MEELCHSCEGQSNVKWEQIPRMVQRKLQKVVNLEVKHAIFFVYAHILLRGKSGHFSTPFSSPGGVSRTEGGSRASHEFGPLGSLKSSSCYYKALHLEYCTYVAEASTMAR